MVKTVKKDDFYRQMFKLAIPIIIQNLLSAAVNSSDVIMLNYVGQSAISDWAQERPFCVRSTLVRKTCRRSTP